MTDNVIKSLKWLISNFPEIENPKDEADRISNCIHLYCQNAVDELNRQQAEIEDLIYKLLGVMHSVDKWLDGDELKGDEVQRAATMREKTLQITEKQQAEIERLQNEKQKIHKIIPKMIKAAKSEAVREFAERVKEEAVTIDGIFETWEVEDLIDNLVKEMAGDGDA